MSEDNQPKIEPIEGHCLCGAVKVRATPLRRHVDACHCTMCRRWNGIAFVGVMCGEIAFEGEEHVTSYRSSDWAERGFCNICGSSLFYHYLPFDHYGFVAGIFPDDALLPIAEEIFIEDKPAYYAFAGDAPKLTGAEVQAKYGIGDGG